jgi:hypothetical protein
MGAAGKHIFEEKFTSELMAKGSMAIYRIAQENFRVLNEN